MPKGHLTYFIGDTVDALDFNAFYVRYAGDGARNQPFHPAMMVKVLVYGFATGVSSSRKIERRLHEDLAFRMLGAGNFPKHRTIRDFRALLGVSGCNRCNADLGCATPNGSWGRDQLFDQSPISCPCTESRMWTTVETGSALRPGHRFANAALN